MFFDTFSKLVIDHPFLNEAYCSILSKICLMYFFSVFEVLMQINTYLPEMHVIIINNKKRRSI